MLHKNYRLRVYESITELLPDIENPTPLVRVSRLNPHEDFKIYLKLERYNPFGSTKDRIAYEMLKGLRIGSNQTVIEPSSGNTGIALACIANAWGIPVEIVVPEGIPEEKKTLLRFLGAKLQEASDNLCPSFPAEGARGLVKALIESPDTRDSYASPDQYQNELNVQAHYKTTGPEIWRQTEGKITHFFAGLGTCGTVSGVGRYLKEQRRDVRIISVEPSSQNHRLPGMKRITGLSADLIPKILAKSVIDELVEVADEDAYGTAIELARKEGILVGPTTGAILYVALQYARSNKGLAVVISPDDAFKYMSFYKDILSAPEKTEKEEEYDLCGLVCPASKIRSTELLDSLKDGDTVRIILGDMDSLKSVMGMLKERGFKRSFKRDGNDRFVLTVTK